MAAVRRQEEMNGTLRNQVEPSKVKTESRFYLLFATKGFSSRATRETKGMTQWRVKPRRGWLFSVPAMAPTLWVVARLCQEGTPGALGQKGGLQGVVTENRQGPVFVDTSSTHLRGDRENTTYYL